MNKILIVLKSEFLRRVRSKWFVIVTILAPIFMLALFAVPAIVGIMTARGDQRTIAVVDETDVLLPMLLAEQVDGLTFVDAATLVDSVRGAVLSGRYDGYLHLPASLAAGEGNATYYSATGGGLTLEPRLEHLLDRIVEQHRLAMSQAPPEVLQIIRTNVPVRMVKLTEEGEAADSAGFSTVVGYLMGFIIYIAMFIYGAYVMHGVLEEKQSRVVEIVISTVRPFQLLMGKVLGIGLMGLVQMALWSIFFLVLSFFAGSILALFLNPADLSLPADASRDALLQAADLQLPSLSPVLFVWFLLFFLGGYLLYASLFAAIGSAVEQQQDAQGLMAPVSMLIIVPLLVMGYILQNPNALPAMLLSFFPFFSPILMTVRIAVTDVPLWEILLALGLLVATFVGTIWISGRIYRVGILMYGKKPTLRDLARWVRYA